MIVAEYKFSTGVFLCGHMANDNNDIMAVSEELGVFYHYKVPALLVN